MASLKFLLIASFVGIAYATIDSSLLTTLGRSGRSDVLITFKGDNSEAIRSIAGRNFRSRLSKVTALNRALRSVTDKSQGDVHTFLKGRNAQSKSFWATNQMVVKNAELSLLQGIDAFPQVNTIQKLPRVEISPVFKSTRGAKADGNSSVEWGVAKIQADKVWSELNVNGQGVVVANIDTGVRRTHEALAENYREDHGWFDPYTGTEEPDDGNGHGTHVMGTIAGSGGIGVAPGAQWIACRGCGSSSCSSDELLACGQFMLAPTLPDGSDPREDLIPDVVCNSWGGLGGSRWYNPMIEAWTAAGIMHAFAIGNSGPRCVSAGSPGDQPGAFSVGSTTDSDQLSIFSSKGPTRTRAIKPEISAPGSDIRSAWYDEDNSYQTISGTSMAAPHVTGVLALMLSGVRGKLEDDTVKIDFESAVNAIEETAVRANLTLAFPNFRCDGLFVPRDRFPNNQFGHGRVDALAAVTQAIESVESPVTEQPN